MLRDDRVANNIRKKLQGSLRLPLRRLRGYSIQFHSADEVCSVQFVSAAIAA
jgi:hypothetical protein